jgi:hypothetical protein
LNDLPTIYGPYVASDSATTDVTLRRLQSFRVQPRSIIHWVNNRNNIAVQQASFVYDSGLVTIPGVKVYKDSSRLAVTFAPLAIAQEDVAPRQYELSQNYPNPFNPSTTIKFELPKASHVSLTVYDILGREVTVLVNEKRDAGVHEVKFDGSNLASGVYFYRLKAGDIVQSKRLLLLK